MKKIIFKILTVISSVFLILSFSGFLILGTLRSVFYDENFIRSIPTESYLEELSDRISERLSENSRYYDIEESVLTSAVNKSVLKTVCEAYYMKIYLELVNGEGNLETPEYPSEYYIQVINDYYMDHVKESGDIITQDAISVMADEFSALTESEIMITNESYIYIISAYTSGAIVKLLLKKSWILFAIALIMGAICIFAKRGSIEIRTTYVSFCFLIPALSIMLFGILFYHYFLNNSLIVGASSLKQFLDAYIFGGLRNLIIKSGIAFAAALSVFVASIGKRSFV